MKPERRQAEVEGAPVEACEAVLRDGPRRRVLWLMVEYFQTLGCSDVKARLPGHTAPEVLSGTLQDHRPDLTCRQGDTARTPVLLEVVLPETLEDPSAEHRWSLLASAARLYSAELHFVVPRWSAAGSVEPRLRHRLREMDVRPGHIWQV